MKFRLPAALTRFFVAGLVSIAMCVAPATGQAQTYKVLYAFTGGSDGGVPSSGVVFDKSGSLYGETWSGGNAGCFYDTCGVVFKLTPSFDGGWTESVLHTFTGGSDGGNPTSGLTFNTAGDLFGVANVGGIDCTTYGCGVAFELNQGSEGWTETELYSFQGGEGGYYPDAGFALDKNGNLCSTMPNGGGTGAPGIVYELSSADGWNEQVLYSFAGNNSGVSPAAAPLFDAKGNLYGTTSCCNAGAVWELQHGRWKEKTLYDFRTGGDDPYSSLIFDKTGNLYGATREGGGENQSGKGVVFKLSKSKSGEWKETVLHLFKGGTDGSTLFSTPAFDKVGNLYGTTYSGGDPSCNCGTVFKLTPGKNGRWKETILHRFTGGSDGSGPQAGVVIDALGNLYGTADLGGNAGCYVNLGCGVVFEITP